MQKHDIIHELVHAGWQSDDVHKGYPILAVEGMAWGLAESLASQKRSRFISVLGDFYFRDLIGLIDPDAKLSEVEEWRELLSYELVGELFIELDKIDSTLFPKLLRDAPGKRLNWVDFCKRVVKKSDAPDAVRKLLNNCQTLFGPLPEDYYIIPLRKPESENVIVSIFLPNLKTQGPIRVEYQLEDDANRTYSDEKLLFVDNGYSQFDVQLPNSSVKLEVKLLFSGKIYSEKFQITSTGGERQ